jgi:hypothetical protein
MRCTQPDAVSCAPPPLRLETLKVRWFVKATPSTTTPRSLPVHGNGSVPNRQANRPAAIARGTRMRQAPTEGSIRHGPRAASRLSAVSRGVTGDLLGDAELSAQGSSNAEWHGGAFQGAAAMPVERILRGAAERAGWTRTGAVGSSRQTVGESWRSVRGSLDHTRRITEPDFNPLPIDVESTWPIYRESLAKPVADQKHGFESVAAVLMVAVFDGAGTRRIFAGGGSARGRPW